jgi:hypothetical protein
MEFVDIPRLSLGWRAFSLLLGLDRQIETGTAGFDNPARALGDIPGHV